VLRPEACYETTMPFEIQWTIGDEVVGLGDDHGTRLQRLAGRAVLPFVPDLQIAYLDRLSQTVLEGD
jgi:hypothetical protein